MVAQRAASERLAAARERILSEWEAEVRRSIPSAATQEKLALRNSLPRILEVMIDKLKAPGARDAVMESKLAIGHGEHRAGDAAYTLEEVIDEYHVLRRVLFRVLEEHSAEVSWEERDLVWDVLFMAIKGAAAEFKDVRDRAQGARARVLDQSNVELKSALGEKSAEAVHREQLLKAIFERVEDYAIFSLDADGRVTSWTVGCERIKKYKREDVIGHHFRMLYPEEGRIRREPEDHLRIAELEGRFRGEGLRQRKTGEIFLADVFITPMRENGKLVGFFKIVTDLTERNRMIQERDLSRTRVESLEEESELRERFTFTLSHDLKNPLSAAKMSAQLIANKSCNEPSHSDLAHRAVRNIRRADDMLGDLLDASRVKAGQPLPLRLEEYDVVAQLRVIADDMATAHGDRFIVRAPDHLSCVWDRGGIRRVVENLLGNGVKYGDPGWPITTELRAAGDRILISVHNHGSPIDARDQQSLFELYKRTNAAAAGPKQGWGLGLTVVRGIAEAHGGIVKVKSLPTEGTTFLLDLPRDARQAVAEE